MGARWASCTLAIVLVACCQSCSARHLLQSGDSSSADDTAAPQLVDSGGDSSAYAPAPPQPAAAAPAPAPAAAPAAAPSPAPGAAAPAAAADRVLVLPPAAGSQPPAAAQQTAPAPAPAGVESDDGSQLVPLVGVPASAPDATPVATFAPTPTPVAASPAVAAPTPTPTPAPTPSSASPPSQQQGLLVGAAQAPAPVGSPPYSSADAQCNPGGSGSSLGLQICEFMTALLPQGMRRQICGRFLPPCPSGGGGGLAAPVSTAGLPNSPGTGRSAAGR